MTAYQITEYNETAAAIAMLRNKYNTVFDVSTPKGLNAAREARAEVRSYRVSLEKLRVEIKAPALERTRLIDAEAKRITAELLAIEEPIDAVIKAEETRKAEERAAKERAEQARIAEIQNRITAMRGAVTAAFNKPPSFTAELMVKVRAVPVTAVEFSEFLAVAETAKTETLETLAGLLAEQQAHEAEQARIAAELEDLNVCGMMKNHALAGAIADVGMGEFKRQIEYKAAWYGRKVIIADRFAPTSKTCSHCGSYRETMPLSVREWTCPDCGTRHDRDVNAARNILSFATAGEVGLARGGSMNLSNHRLGTPVEARTEAEKLDEAVRRERAASSKGADSNLLL